MDDAIMRLLILKWLNYLLALIHITFSAMLLLSVRISWQILWRSRAIGSNSLFLTMFALFPVFIHFICRTQKRGRLKRNLAPEYDLNRALVGEFRHAAQQAMAPLIYAIRSKLVNSRQ